MGKDHGAKKQKKLAKQKAKRQEKRATLARRTSDDPTVRLRQADRWPVVRSLVANSTWEDGIGHVLLARQDAAGHVVVGLYLVDMYCLGVKDAFWRPCSTIDLEEMIAEIEETQKLRSVEPACLAKLVQGAVEYARGLGFSPHADFRHASLLLAGLDPAACSREFAYGRDGKPFYVSGPNDSPQMVRAAVEKVIAAGGHYLAHIATDFSPALPTGDDAPGDQEGDDESSPEALPES